MRWDQDNHFPQDVVDKMFELGLTTVGVPAEYGMLVQIMWHKI